MRIYIDNAATTKTRPEVLNAMEPYFSKKYGNPESFHDAGREAKEGIEKSRLKVAQILRCSPEEIIFVSGGTESCNLAIKGIALKYPKGHIITQKTEHHAILRPLEWLENKGYSVTYLDVDSEGMITPEQIRKAIRKDTILVTIMQANNEIGTIYPIPEISKICKENNIVFHTDACQGATTLELDVEKLGVDLMTLNGSKIYGPKGIGALFVKRGIRIEPLIHGSNQEGGRRGGTQNVPGIIGFSKALELAHTEKEKETSRLIKLQKKLIEGLTSIERAKLNGPMGENRLANNISVSFHGVEGESIILHLNEQGICASTGSACSSGDLQASHVLKAIGREESYIHGTVRFSLGHYNTMEQVENVVNATKDIISKLRMISPITKGE